MTPAQLDETEDRLPKTLRDKMRAREEAMANHVQLKMSRKIRQAILAKVRTEERKLLEDGSTGKEQMKRIGGVPVSW